MNKNKIYNILMVVAIAVILVVGILFSLDTKGVMDSEVKKTQSVATANNIGIANIERKSIAFSLENGLALQEKDIINTESQSQITLQAKENEIIIMPESIIEVVNADVENPEFNLVEGQIIVDFEKNNNITINVDEATVQSQAGVITLNKQHGSTTLNVLAGSVGFNEETVNAKESLLILKDSTEKADVTASFYSDYDIKTLKPLAETETLCVSVADFDAVLEKRLEEKNAEDEAQDLIKQETADENAILDDPDITDDEITSAPLTVTLEIRADTILNNMGDLKAGKDVYVPSDGTILPTSTLEFTEGESAYDVIKRACEYAGIQFEYEFFPIYDSHYIEGINHLYEFDCGSGSGWVYKVNGWKPNYGVTQYDLQDGDVIKIYYTCDYGNEYD